VLGFLLLGMLYAGVLVLTVHRSRRTKAVMVMRHLQREGSCTLAVGPFASVWTPERPPSKTRLPMGFYQMPGRGRLTYSLIDEEVHLLWTPKRGSPREWVGPVPVTATIDYQTTMRRGMAVAAAVFLVLGAGGAVLGMFTGSVLAGLGGGLFAGFFIGSTAWSANQMKAFRLAHEKLVNRSSDAENTVDPPTTEERPRAGTSPRHERKDLNRKRVVRTVYLLYGGVLVLGFVLGFVLAGGTGLRRFIVGVLGLFLALALMSLLSGLLRAGTAGRTPKPRDAGKTPQR
jgi:hypothetical protein